MPYTVEVRENGQQRDKHEIVDPFIHTTVRPRGLRAVLAVLFRRYEITVCVDADSETVERVMELNPDYLGPPGSKSRLRWNKELNAALLDFADRID